MLREKIIDKALSAEDSIVTERSRCLRMRFNHNSCTGCVEQCRFNAITITDDVYIKTGECSECMLCVSACPSDCFDISGLDFYSVIGKLRKVQASVASPVLGCRANAKTPSHEKTFCFGFLSEEHIIALVVFMNNQLQIDLSGCADCRNSFVVAALEKRIAGVEAKTSLKISDRIKIVKNKADIKFNDVSYDRRGFFKALKNATFMKAAGLFGDEDTGEELRAYSAKKLPFKRELLNRALSVLPDETKKALLKNYYYDVTATDACNNCFACIGMCPTGALKIEDKDDDNRELFFSSSLCSGCGLCRDFCFNSALRIEKGFTGGSPLEFISAKKEVLCGV
ncbi:MAG: hypothetical protein C4550_01940 [Nitrospiraceae bacterium]|nr:MAG: hypothetical protein C4550_01940 [Nitrospiraceae bacterium]